MVSYGTKAVDIYQSRTKDPVKSLWRNVLVVAIEDAIKACVMKHKYKADVTFHDLLYITEPNQDFATICHYADLDHNLVRKKVGLTFKVIEENLERKDYIKKNDKKLDYQKNLTINNLDFKYKINKEYTLKDVSLSLSGKDKIGIFGESGSGKSTLLNLILGFLEPDEINSVKSNNISIYKDKESWRANISYVPQRVVILDQSLKSNVILSNPFMEFNQSKYKNAVEMSGLNTVIDKLENKDETLLGEDGDKISMGEKQRIGIARAIYRDSQIIIMDEMSNFLDEKNKSEIIENIHDFFSDKIIIMVSHDKEVLKYSNKIYELKDKKLNLLKI